MALSFGTSLQARFHFSINTFAGRDPGRAGGDFENVLRECTTPAPKETWPAIIAAQQQSVTQYKRQTCCQVMKALLSQT